VPTFQPTSTIPGDCANCHTGVERVTTNFQGMQFAHEKHVLDQGIACSTCHSNAVEHGELVLSPASCNSCHHKAGGPVAGVTCETCHQTAAAIFNGTYLAQDTPDYMSDGGVVCEDCHRPAEDVVRPVLAQCADCHDDDYIEYGQEWRDEISSLLDELAGLLNAVPTAQRSSDVYTGARQILADFRKSGANGLHNHELMLSVLEENLDAVRGLSGN
jgi:hypothetical protein